MTETAIKRKLTLLDRCDRCNAAAKVVATKEDKELFFCEHHKRKYENNLTLQKWIINKGKNNE